MTHHMKITQHYTNIISQEQITSWRQPENTDGNIKHQTQEVDEDTEGEDTDVTSEKRDPSSPMQNDRLKEVEDSIKKGHQENDTRNSNDDDEKDEENDHDGDRDDDGAIADTEANDADAHDDSNKDADEEVERVVKSVKRDKSVHSNGRDSLTPVPNDRLKEQDIIKRHQQQRQRQRQRPEQDDEGDEGQDDKDNDNDGGGGGDDDDEQRDIDEGKTNENDDDDHDDHDDDETSETNDSAVAKIISEATKAASGDKGDTGDPLSALETMVEKSFDPRMRPGAANGGILQRLGIDEEVCPPWQHINYANWYAAAAYGHPMAAALLAAGINLQNGIKLSKNVETPKKDVVVVNKNQENNSSRKK